MLSCTGLDSEVRISSLKDSYRYISAKNAQTEGEKIALVSHFPPLNKKKKKKKNLL